ncbi:MAG: hypothetical protein ACFFCQ_07315 [Promethearchaeota archaeon]
MRKKSKSITLKDKESLVSHHNSNKIGAGQQFYVESPEQDFIKRIGSWLDYLSITHHFPNLDDLKGKILEVGDRLRNAGDSSFFGTSDEQNQILLIRPGDYATLLHEITHSNPKLKKSLLSSEAGAFALEILCVGDFDYTLESLLYSRSYSQRDKRLGKIVAEISLVLGLKLIDFLVNEDNKITEAKLLSKLRKIIEDTEREYFIEQKRSPTDYLVEFHGLSPTVAKYLLNTTGDTHKTVMRSITQTKKDVTGAFRGLVSFYHINLGYSLEEAIIKTEMHFEREEALTIYKTLTQGAKDVFAKLREYGYPLDACKKISEAIISFGGARSQEYANGVPKFLELIAQFGPYGRNFLGFALSNKAFFDVLVLTNYSKALLNLSLTEPELVPMLLGELAQYDWNNSTITFNEFLTFMFDSYMHRDVFDLTPELKAQSFALFMYVLSLEQSNRKAFMKKHQLNPASTSRTLFSNMVKGDGSLTKEENILRLARKLQIWHTKKKPGLKWGQKLLHAKKS